MKLTVELIPKTAWGQNVRAILPRAQWEVVRKKCIEAAGNKCEICGRKGTPKRRQKLECHEVWQYDDNRFSQTLIGFVALCPACHKVKHLGQAFKIGRGERAMRHLAKVNNWTHSEVLEYLDEVFDTWLWRSQYDWTVNTDFLKEYMES